MDRKECDLSLDELLKFDGVMAAGIFSPDGNLSITRPTLRCQKKWPG